MSLSFYCSPHLIWLGELLMSSKDKETIGNFVVSKDGLMSRREILMMGAAAAVTTGLTARAVQAAGPTGLTTSGGASAATAAGKEVYVARDFSALVAKKLDGLSANQIEQHLKLYKGYVTKSNEIMSKIKEVDISTANATYSPLRELLMEQSFAVNGAIYHELYFGNLGGPGGEPTGDLKAAMDETFGNTGKFMDFLKASGKSMRGWVVVGWNQRGNRIDTFGLDTHNMWSPAGFIPLLVLDVYEHAYMIDYAIDRAKYLDAFVKNIDWNVVSKRFTAASKYPTGLDLTV